MTKSGYKEVNEIIAHCGEKMLDVANTFNELANGTLEWDSEKKELITVEPKLTKAEQEVKEINDAARNAVATLVITDGYDKMSVDQIKREACKLQVTAYVAKPKLFKQAVHRFIDEFDKARGFNAQRTDKKGQIKEADLNPVMRKFAEDNGLEIIPLPDQKPIP